MVEKSTVSTRAGEFIVFQDGSGRPPVLYLHAEAATAPDPAASLLAVSTQVVCPVHPGFGEAPRPRWVETVRDVADLYVDLLDEVVGEQKVVLVGPSLGGWIAAELALLVPRRVSHLVLVGAAGLWVPDTPPADHWFATDEERMSMLFEDSKRAPAIDMAEYVANDETTARYAWSPRFCDPTLTHRVRRLDMPSLILWGQADHLLPSAHGEAWAASLPRATLRVISGSGHFPGYERPEEVVRAISEFALLGEAVATRTGAEER